MQEHVYEYSLTEEDTTKFYRSEVEPDDFVAILEEYEQGITQFSNVFEHMKHHLPTLQEVTEAHVVEEDTYTFCVGGNG